MSKSQDMAGIIERLEAASGPDRELDALIALHNGWNCWRSKHGYWNIDWKDAEGKFCNWTTGADPFGPKFDPETGKKNADYDRMPLDWAWDADVPEYTHSIDAALSLVPEGWIVQLDDERGAWQAILVQRGKRDDFRRAFDARCDHAPTPAIALCIAALRARAHKE